MSATAVKDYGINDDQKSVDRSEESVILEDLSLSPLESDHARLLKSDVVEATNSRSAGKLAYTEYHQCTPYVYKKSASSTGMGRR